MSAIGIETKVTFKLKTNVIDLFAGRTRKGLLIDLTTRVEGRAKDKVPVLTSNLRRSITHKFDGDWRWALVGTNVEYAPHVEFGTVHQEAQPYLVPALEEITREGLTRG